MEVPQATNLVSVAANFSKIRFDDAGVVLALGPYVVSTRVPSELANPSNWRIGASDALGGDYADYEFAPLTSLAAAAEVSVTSGAHRRCANPPTPAPAGTEQLTQIAVQPTAVPSCLSWFAVDLFLRDDRIVAVRFDLWGP